MAKTEEVRIMNLKKIKQVFLEDGICTKNMLAAKTGLSLGTCTNLLKYLLEQQMIKRIEDSQSTGGRKAKRYQLIDDVNDYGLAFLFGDQLYLETIDLRGQVRVSHIIEIKDDIEKTIDAWVNQRFKKIVFCNMDASLFEKYGIVYQSEDAVSLACLGYARQHQIQNLAFIHQSNQQLSECGLMIGGKLYHGSSQFAGNLSGLPIQNLPEQLKTMRSKKEATSLLGKQIAALAAILNPRSIVVCVDKITSLEKLQNKVLKWIPSNQLPNIVEEKDFIFWVMRGLVNLCMEEE